MITSHFTIGGTQRRRPGLGLSAALCATLLACASAQAGSLAIRPMTTAAAQAHTTSAQAATTSRKLPATTKIPDCGPNGERICTPHGCYCA